MRVVGGRVRGRNIASPSSNDIRPTQDRLRESLFNILMHAYENPIDGARVLDLFAGTGALGIEAVSRGAAFALFVDNGAEARALLRNNVEALGSAASPRYFVAMRQIWASLSDGTVFAGVSRSALRQAPRRQVAGLSARRQVADAMRWSWSRSEAALGGAGGFRGIGTPRL